MRSCSRSIACLSRSWQSLKAASEQSPYLPAIVNPLHNLSTFLDRKFFGKKYSEDIARRLGSVLAHNDQMELISLVASGRFIKEDIRAMAERDEAEGAGEKAEGRTPSKPLAMQTGTWLAQIFGWLPAWKILLPLRLLIMRTAVWRETREFFMHPLEDYFRLREGRQPLAFRSSPEMSRIVILHYQKPFEQFIDLLKEAFIAAHSRKIFVGDRREPLAREETGHDAWQKHMQQIRAVAHKIAEPFMSEYYYRARPLIEFAANGSAAYLAEKFHAPPTVLSDVICAVSSQINMLIPAVQSYYRHVEYNEAVIVQRQNQALAIGLKAGDDILAVLNRQAAKYGKSIPAALAVAKLQQTIGSYRLLEGREIPQDISGLNQVVLLRKSASDGRVLIGRRDKSAKFTDHKYELYLEFVDQGVVTRVVFLDKFEDLVLVTAWESVTEKIITSFSATVKKAELLSLLRHYSNITLKNMKTKSEGRIEFAGRKWIKFGPDREDEYVNIEIAEGLRNQEPVGVIKAVGFLKDGQKETLALIYDSLTGLLEQSFYSEVSKADLAKLTHHIVKQYLLNKNGEVRLGGEVWGQFARDAGAEVAIEVIKGIPTWLTFIKDKDDQPILDHEGHPLRVKLDRTIRDQMLKKDPRRRETIEK